MRYSVEITEAALADAEEYVLFIREQSNDDQAAANWWNGLLETVDSLESFPARCPRVPEQRYFAGDIRQFVYESHRIIFELEAELVTVLRIYHGARKPLTKAQMKKRAR